MRVQPITIGAASPDEIDRFVDIDDDACTLFDTVGLHDDRGPHHPFSRAERERWLQSARQGGAFFALTPAGMPVGLLVVAFVDGLGYVEQLSVRRAAMRQGIGRSLLRHAIAWAGDAPLWLTTYAHVPWNRDFYARAGFVVVPPSRCPRAVVAILEEERRWLPAPDQRIAMRWERARGGHGRCRSVPKAPAA